MTNVCALSNDDLLAQLDSVLGSQRQLLARLVQCLTEVEERRLHLVQAYGSMFEFCTSRLGMSEGEAFRRITAARLAKDFPVIVEAIASGAIHLSGLVLLRDYLTAENHAELLREASGKSKRGIEELIAARFPKPDAPTRLRKLPTQSPQAALGLEAGAGSPPAPRRQRNADNGRVEPLAATRYDPGKSPAGDKVQFTASEELRNKLERAKNLMSHANPTGDLAVIVERALDLLLAELEKTRLGKTKRPRRRRPAKPGTITRAARGETFERDGEQCSFVSADGRRCQAKAFLELDHVESRALGGSDETTNLRVRCRAHNQLWAERTFGREHLERRKRLRQRKSMRETSSPRSETPRDDSYDKLQSVLVGMGFGPKPTRAALEKLRHGRAGATAGKGSVEELLRAALQMLSP